MSVRITILTVVVFLCGISCISSNIVDTVDTNISMNYDFADIFFIKSLTNVNVNLTEYLIVASI